MRGATSRSPRSGRAGRDLWRRGGGSACARIRRTCRSRLARDRRPVRGRGGPGDRPDARRRFRRPLGADGPGDGSPSGQLYEGRCDSSWAAAHSRVPRRQAAPDVRGALLTSSARPSCPPRSCVRGLDELGARSSACSDGRWATTSCPARLQSQGLSHAEELFTALAQSEVDAAVIDSPLAGWFVTKTAGFRSMEVSDSRSRRPDRRRSAHGRCRSQGARSTRRIRRLQATTLPAILARYGIAPASTPSAGDAAECRSERRGPTYSRSARMPRRGREGNTGGREPSAFKGSRRTSCESSGTAGRGRR